MSSSILITCPRPQANICTSQIKFRSILTISPFFAVKTLHVNVSAPSSPIFFKHHKALCPQNPKIFGRGHAARSHIRFIPLTIQINSFVHTNSGTVFLKDYLLQKTNRISQLFSHACAVSKTRFTCESFNRQKAQLLSFKLSKKSATFPR